MLVVLIYNCKSNNSQKYCSLLNKNLIELGDPLSYIYMFIKACIMSILLYIVITNIFIVTNINSQVSKLNEILYIILLHNISIDFLILYIN